MKLKSFFISLEIKRIRTVISPRAERWKQKCLDGGFKAARTILERAFTGFTQERVAEPEVAEIVGCGEALRRRRARGSPRDARLCPSAE